MLILRIFSKQHILILDRTNPSAGVGPDLSATHVQRQDEEGQGNLGSEVYCIDIRIQGSNERENNHEELKKSNRHNHKVYCSCMNFLVDAAPGVDKSKIMTIYEMFEDEVETAKWSDERTGDGEHDHHRKDQHHPCILLTKSKFIDDSFSNCWRICFTSGQTDLYEIPEEFWKPDQLQSRPNDC